ncbi:hypothetical protein [Paraburkholderia sp. BCC1876]|uniref:hypothetical protein n=1 Tax=Paraburkholderia sp. BCC1876 TaxID=2676303 RepID=UPI00159223AE|nr:hypothetical protein [Paraburkholderia sp. BCC1876]
MRFDRTPRFEGLTWTARKEAAYLRRHKRAQDKIDRDFPLFAHQFAPAPMNDVDAEKERRQRLALAGEQRMRDLDAKHWREGRAAYFACGRAVRERIMVEWTSWRGPAKALYFIYVVEKHSGAAEERARECRAREAALRARIEQQFDAAASLPLF